MSELRRCTACGSQLARDNRGLDKLCSPCERAKTLANIGDRSEWVMIHARQVVGAYGTTAAFDSGTDYLSNLTEHLDSLCEAMGVPLPRMPDQWTGLNGRTLQDGDIAVHDVERLRIAR